MATVYFRRLHGWRFVLFNAVLGLSHIVVLFNAGSYIALLPHVSGDLGGVLPSFLTWAQTDFHGRVGPGVSPRAILVGPDRRLPSLDRGVHGLQRGLLFCGDSQTLAQFVPARIVQGIAGGITLPIAQSMLLNEYPKRLKAVALTVWGLFSITPFTIGMPVGGYIAYMLGWRFLFYLDFVLTLVIVGTLGRAVVRPRVSPAVCPFRSGRVSAAGGSAPGPSDVAQHGQRFRLAGFALSSGHCRGPADCLSLFHHLGTGGAPSDTGSSTVHASQFCDRPHQPDPRIFLDPRAVVALDRADPTDSGLFVETGGDWRCSRWSCWARRPSRSCISLCKYIDARWLICLNSLGFAWTFIGLGLYDDPHSYEELFWPMVVEGMFLGSFFTPVTVLTLHGLSGPLVMRAAEVANLLRVAAGAFGITFQGIVLFRRIHFHQLAFGRPLWGTAVDLLRSDGTIVGKIGRGGTVAAGRFRPSSDS